MNNEELQQLKALAEAATSGPWEAKAGYGSGLEIYMAHPQYPDKDWPAFGTNSAWCKKGLVSYETWVQFPNEVRDAAQQRNASFIAAANPAAVLTLIAKVESLAADAERLNFLEKNSAYKIGAEKTLFMIGEYDVPGQIRNIREAIDMAKEKA